MNAYSNMAMGALLSTVFVLMSVSIASEGLFHSEAPEKAGFAIVAEEAPSAGGEAAAPAAVPIAQLMAKADAAARKSYEGDGQNSEGERRESPALARQFADFNAFISIGGFLFGASQLIFVWVLVKCARGGEKATAQVWEGAEGLEWEVPSPAPYHTFETPPVIK